MSRTGRHATGRRIRSLRAALVAAAAATLSIITLTTPAAANPAQPSTVFDRNTVRSDFVYNRTSAQIASDILQRAAAGLMVIDLEVFDLNITRYAAVFQANTDNRRWRALRDMTEDQFRTEFAKARNENLRIVDVETYKIPAGNRFAAVWLENRENLATEKFLGQTSDQLRNTAAQQDDLGRMPIDVEQYNVDGCAHCYSSIWVANREGLRWSIWWGLNSDTFARKSDELEADNYRMLAVSSNLHTKKHAFEPDEAWNVYNGVWVENRNGRGWIEKDDMLPNEFAQRLTEMKARGLRPIAYEQYMTKATCSIINGCIYTLTHAMIWRANI